MATGLFWAEFGVLFAAALLGGVAVLPYGLRLLKASSRNKPLKWPLPKLLLLSFLQTAVLSAVTVGVGLWTAHAIGLGAPYIAAALSHGSPPSVGPTLQAALALGAIGGTALLGMDWLFLPRLPEALLDTARKTTLWENVAASFYGGLNEEFMMRLFGMSVLAWLLARLWHTPAGLPTDAVFWAANVAMAVVFGLGHLPAAKALVGHLSPLMLTRTLLLNAPVGLLCGWLFWRYGIEAAVVAHFTVDIGYHAGGTLALQLHDRSRSDGA